MADNLHPVTGERLTQRTNSNRRIGYDFVMSGPKSFSIALALAPDDLRPLLQHAFDDAAMETMENHIEPAMMTRVRKDGAFENRRTGNMCWAMFPHTTSRPVRAKVPRSPNTTKACGGPGERSDGPASGLEWFQGRRLERDRKPIQAMWAARGPLPYH